MSVGAKRGVGRRTDAKPTALDEAMMARALELARDAARSGEVPVGAVVYRLDGGEILGEGSNTREARRDPAGHAEFIAITRACSALGDWRCTGLGVAVTLEPCAMCAGLIVNARVDRVVYGCHDPKAGCVRTLARLADDPRLNHRAAIVPGVMAEACSAELRAFFRSLRKR